MGDHITSWCVQTIAQITRRKKEEKKLSVNQENLENRKNTGRTKKRKKGNIGQNFWKLQIFLFFRNILKHSLLFKIGKSICVGQPTQL